MSAPGAGSREDNVQSVIDAVGLEWRPWAGGAVAAALAHGNGIPTLAAAKAASIARGHLVPGGALIMRAAKLESLGIADPTRVEVAAAFLLGYEYQGHPYLKAPGSTSASLPMTLKWMVERASSKNSRQD